MPKLPTGGNKRKMPSAPTPEMLKRMRMDADGDEDAPVAPVADAPKPRKAYIRTEEEEEEDVSMDVDTEFAPGGDADYFAEEDEEGRFYGGGLTAQQKEILNIFDQAGGEEGVQGNVSTAQCWAGGSDAC
jgi:beta-catenin-like protein 1